MTKLIYEKFIILVFIAVGPLSLFASERHHKTTSVINNMYTITPSGTALSLGAAAIDCSYGTNKWQGGVGVGYYEDETAPAIGLCKKYDSGLYKFTIGNESGNTGASIGATFTFN